MDYRVHGILQARILEWLAFLFSRDLPNPGMEPRSPSLQVDSLPVEPPGKPKNTGIGSLSLLHQMFPTLELNWGLLHCRRILYQLSYQGNLCESRSPFLDDVRWHISLEKISFVFFYWKLGNKVTFSSGLSGVKLLIILSPNAYHRLLTRMLQGEGHTLTNILQPSSGLFLSLNFSSFPPPWLSPPHLITVSPTIVSSGTGKHQTSIDKWVSCEGIRSLLCLVRSFAFPCHLTPQASSCDPALLPEALQLAPDLYQCLSPVYQRLL